MTAEQEKLVLDNINLVYSITKPYRTRNNYEDIVSEGYLGLCQAAINFQPLRGNCFSTYAYSYILGKCLNFINKDKLIKPHRLGNVFEDVFTTVSIDSDNAKASALSSEEWYTKVAEDLMIDDMRERLTEEEFTVVISLYAGYTKKDVMNLLQINNNKLTIYLNEIQNKLRYLKY